MILQCASKVYAGIQRKVANCSYDTFSNVSRGLFESHKLIFSFMICIETMREKNLIDALEWNFLLRGSTVLRHNYPPKPNARWLSTYLWHNVCNLSFAIPQFGYLIDHINLYPSHWEDLINSDRYLHI
jgi:dynein heavy chain, axonemal